VRSCASVTLDRASRRRRRSPEEIRTRISAETELTASAGSLTTSSLPNFPHITASLTGSSSSLPGSDHFTWRAKPVSCHIRFLSYSEGEGVRDRLWMGMERVEQASGHYGCRFGGSLGRLLEQ
jgi:hypothetical protein